MVCFSLVNNEIHISCAQLSYETHLGALPNSSLAGMLILN